MDQTELESLTTAILSRLAGSNRQPARSRLGIGSGVPRPAALDSSDLAVQRDARATYVKEMTDRAPLEQLSPAEREEYFKATQDVLRGDGYYVD